jgi:hypothetical protein
VTPRRAWNGLVAPFACLLGAALGAMSAGAASADELGPKDVVSVMASRRAAIRQLCYENHAKKADTSLKVDFDIAPSGVVTDAVAREPSGPAEIVACVVAEVKKTTFPASAKGGHYRWPFIFKGP